MIDSESRHHNTLAIASYMSVQKPGTAADILDAAQTQEHTVTTNIALMLPSLLEPLFHHYPAVSMTSWLMKVDDI